MMAWTSAALVGLSGVGDASCARTAVGNRAKPRPSAAPSSNCRRCARGKFSFLEKIIETALDPFKVFCHQVVRTHVHVNLSLQHLAGGIERVFENHGNFFL